MKIDTVRWGRVSFGLCLLSLTLSMVGCGAGGFAPDALVENPKAEAFLTQIGRACGNLNLGTSTVGALLQDQDDVYFVDETTKLWFGDVSRAQYADDISAFYPVGEVSKAIDCIFGQLPPKSAQP